MLSATNTTASGTNNLAFSGHLYANRFNNLELTQGTHGFTINGGSTDRNSIIFNNSASWTGNLTLNAWTASELRMYKGLIIGGTAESTGSITLTTAAGAASPTLTIGATATANTLPIFDANAALTTLANGTAGQSLRIINIGTTEAPVLAPRWTTGGSVDQNLVLKFDTGTTEGTDLYTYNGSAAKTVDFIGGDLITITSAAGSVTFDHDALAEAYGTTADTQTTLSNIEILNSLSVDNYGHVASAEFRKLVAGTYLGIVATDNGNITFSHNNTTRTDGTNTAVQPGFGQTFTLVDQVDTNATGHVTSVKTKTITMPTETTLSVVDNGTGTWLTDVEVNNHQVTLSRSNTTDATIQVGELIISTANSKTGNLTVGGNAVITGNLTVNGTTTTLNTETVLVEDNIIEINSTQTGTPASSLVSGIEVNRGDEPNFQFVFVELSDDFRLGKVGGTLQPVLTRDELSNLANNDILVWDNENKRAIGKTFDELALPNKYAVTIGDGVATTYTITHNLNTADITYSVREVATGEIVFTNVTVTGVNAISVSFAVAPTSNQYRVVVIG